jgi:hypothetical protein
VPAKEAAVRAVSRCFLSEGDRSGSGTIRHATVSNQRSGSGSEQE